MSPSRPAADDAPRCSACGRPVPAEGSDRPFCSSRCRMVDLGRWLNEEYKVAGESAIAFDEGLGEGYVGSAGEEPDERDA